MFTSPKLHALISIEQRILPSPKYIEAKQPLFLADECASFLLSNLLPCCIVERPQIHSIPSLLPPTASFLSHTTFKMIFQVEGIFTLTVLLLFLLADCSLAIRCRCYGSLHCFSNETSLPLWRLCEGAHCVVERRIFMSGEYGAIYTNFCGQETLEGDECVEQVRDSIFPRTTICRCTTPMCNADSFVVEWEEAHPTTTTVSSITTESPEAVRRRKEEKARRQRETAAQAKKDLLLAMLIFGLPVVVCCLILTRYKSVPRRGRTPVATSEQSPRTEMLCQVTSVPAADRCIPSGNDDPPPSYEEVCRGLPYRQLLVP
uniref:Activin_recp domain-containing protein n=1 Tax=Steinernema glaseri TaxID=37863 RepID=A0A1I7YVV2_9BILA